MSAASTVFFGFLLSVCLTFAVQSSVFRSSSQEIEALIGNDVTIACSINNHMASDVVFWQNGSMVLATNRQVYQPPDSNRISIEASSGNTFNLRIRNVTIYDAGNYSCQVGARGTQYNRLVVNVPASIKFSPDVKTITVEEVEEADDIVLSLRCIAFGIPSPSVRWYFHGKEGPLEIPDSRGNETLKLSDVNRHDAGEYECRATNEIGVPASRKIEVVVEYAPTVADGMSVIYVAPGQDAAIECFFSANPDVDTVRWYHNGSELNLERQTNVKDNRRKTDLHDVWALDIRGLRPDQLGMYACKGENKIGSVTDTVQLSPLPYDLKILGIRKTKYSEQYVLHWTVSSPMELQSFVIAVKQLNDSFNIDWHNFTIPVSLPQRKPSHSQEYTFQQLAVRTNYTILIRARNLYGYSDWSESLTFHTSESRGTFAEPETSLLLLMLLVFSLLKNCNEVIH